MPSINYIHGVCTTERLKIYDKDHLVTVYNDMIKDGLQAGLNRERYKIITSFRSIDEAIMRVQSLHSSVIAARESLAAIQNEAKGLPQQTKPQELKIMTAPKRKAIPDESIITLLAPANPKRAASASAERFAHYRTGMTVAEYIAAAGDKALADLKYDTEKGFISIAFAKQQAA